MGHPGDLEGVETIGGPDAFDGLNDRVVGYPTHFVDTGPDCFPIKNNGTGPALAGFTANLTAREQ